MSHRCTVCKQIKEGCRVDLNEGAFGVIFAPVCESCYAKETAEAKAEAKRFGYRTNRKSWAKLPIAEDK